MGFLCLMIGLLCAAIVLCGLAVSGELADIADKVAHIKIEIVAKDEHEEGEDDLK